MTPIEFKDNPVWGDSGEYLKRLKEGSENEMKFKEMIEGDWKTQPILGTMLNGKTWIPAKNSGNTVLYVGSRDDFLRYIHDNEPVLKDCIRNVNRIDDIRGTNDFVDYIESPSLQMTDSNFNLIQRIQERMISKDGIDTYKNPPYFI